MRYAAIRLSSCLSLQLLVSINHQGEPVRNLSLELLLTVLLLVAQHGLKDDVLGARGYIEILEEEQLTEH